MTQHDLARAAGMPQPSIARIEAGTVIPRTRDADRAPVCHRASAGSGTSRPGRGSRWPFDSRLAMEVPSRTPKTGRILQRLRRFGVPFVLVGELCGGRAWLASQGRPEDRGLRCVDGQPRQGSAQVGAGRPRLPQPMRIRLRVLTETAAGDAYDVLRRNAVPLHVEAGILVWSHASKTSFGARRAHCTQEDRAGGPRRWAPSSRSRSASTR